MKLLFSVNEMQGADIHSVPKMYSTHYMVSVYVSEVLRDAYEFNVNDLLFPHDN